MKNNNYPENEYILKTGIKERKKFGQFFTPYEIASFMVDWVFTSDSFRKVLEPAFGLGIYSRIIFDKYPEANFNIKAFETDLNIYSEAKKLFRNSKHFYKLELLNQDYFSDNWNEKYDSIICNPPYSNFKYYENKLVLRQFLNEFGIKFSGFTNIYSLFLIKSIFQLNENGRAAYIIPSEFLNSDYGKLIKEYILSSKSLKVLITLDFGINLFDDVLTTSSILLFSKDTTSDEIHFLNAKNMSELSEIFDEVKKYPVISPKISKIFKAESLDPSKKWRIYYQDFNSHKYNNLVPFSLFGKVSRGIATGDNSFFLFNLEKKNKYIIDDKNLIPCISKVNDIKCNFFTLSEFEKLKKLNKNIFIINLNINQDENIINYIKIGEKNNVHKKYLTGKRKPWYNLEKRLPAPILVSTFNRKGLKFLRNEINISNLTTFHCIYIEENNIGKIDLIFAYLLTNVSKEIFDENKREYGNGLSKFEPNDINNSLIINFNIIDSDSEKKILENYFKYRDSELNGKPEKSLIDNIESLFMKFLT